MLQIVKSRENHAVVITSIIDAHVLLSTFTSLESHMTASRSGYNAHNYECHGVEGA